MNLGTTALIDKYSQDAHRMSSKLDNVFIRKKACLDFMGGLYVIDVLNGMGLRTTHQRSVFKAPQVFEDFKFVDIYCNLHMLYVITINNTKTVRIPSLHKRYGILPEAYIVVNLKNDSTHAEIKGIILPDDIINAEFLGDDFLFNANNLRPLDEIIPALKKYKITKSSIGSHMDTMSLFAPYADNTLDEEGKIKLIKHILTCETCKRRFLDTISTHGINNSFNTIGNTVDDRQKKQETVSKLPLKISPQTETINNNSAAKNAIDVLYRDKIKNFKTEILKFRPAVSKKTRFLILLSLGVVLLLFVLSAFAFNIPNKSKEKQPPIEQFSDIQENYEDDTNSPDTLVPKIAKSEGYSKVSKVSWEVSSKITSDAQKNFLQSAGKNIRLNLQNDLLLSSDVVVKTRVKYDILFTRDGSLDDIIVNQSSGSSAVDKIIIQSIEDNLRYMRAPRNSFVGRKNALTLVVDF